MSIERSLQDYVNRLPTGHELPPVFADAGFAGKLSNLSATGLQARDGTDFDKLSPKIDENDRLRDPETVSL